MNFLEKDIQLLVFIKLYNVWIQHFGQELSANIVNLLDKGQSKHSFRELVNYTNFPVVQGFNFYSL